MWIDLLITAPVVVFLLWLYWYATRNARAKRQRTIDRLTLAATPLVAAAVIVGCHYGIDLDGAGLNVIAVASGYLSALAVLAVGWWARGRG